MNDLYTVLGIDRSATLEEVKRAFWKRSKETHPDKGGDAEEFREVTTAFDVLSDPEKRKAYDLGGCADSAAKGLTRIETLLKASVASRLRMTSASEDLIQILRRIIMDGVDVKQAEKSEYEAAISKLETMEELYLRNGEGPNIFAQAIREALGGIRVQILAVESDLTDAFEMLEYLSHYQFKGVRPLYSRISTREEAVASLMRGFGC